PAVFTLSLHDALPIYRLAGLKIELNDRRTVGAVAAIGAATVDRPDLAMRAAFDSRARAPWRSGGRRRPLMFRRAIRAGDRILPQDRKSTRLNSSHVSI